MPTAILYNKKKKLFSILRLFMISEFLAVRPAKAAVAATVRFSLWFALRCLCFWFCLGLGTQFRSQVRPVTSKQSAVHSPQSTVRSPQSAVQCLGSPLLFGSVWFGSFDS